MVNTSNDFGSSSDESAQTPSNGSGFIPPATAQYAPYQSAEVNVQPVSGIPATTNPDTVNKAFANKMLNIVVLIICIMVPVSMFFYFTYDKDIDTEQANFKPVLTDSTRDAYITPINEDIPQTGDVTKGENGYDPNTDFEVNYFEAQWKMGLSNEPLPQSFNQTNGFADGYGTPETWLASQGVTDMKVVFTADPNENCAAKDVDFTKNTDYLVLGCYKYEYGKTLLMWWGPEADDNMKKLVLLNQYSHFVQYWSHYDVSISAIMDGRGYNENDAFYKMRETDASCRIFYEWNYSDLEYYNNRLVNACNVSNWTPDWCEQETEKLGVTIADW